MLTHFSFWRACISDIRRCFAPPPVGRDVILRVIRVNGSAGRDTMLGATACKCDGRWRDGVRPSAVEKITSFGSWWPSGCPGNE